MATDLVDTPRGPARVQADDPDGPPRGLLVLGHGAGGGITAPDLVAVTDTAVRLGLAVRRVEQPYRVAGRRSPGWPAGRRPRPAPPPCCAWPSRCTRPAGRRRPGCRNWTRSPCRCWWRRATGTRSACRRRRPEGPSWWCRAPTTRCAATWPRSAVR